MDPHCFDADPGPDPDPAQNIDADPDPDTDPDPGEGGRSAKNVHPPWQNPRYAPAELRVRNFEPLTKRSKISHLGIFKVVPYPHVS